MAIIAACFFSCTSTKNNVKEISVGDYYQDNPYAQPYLKKPFSDFLLTYYQVQIYAHAFRNHKYRVWRRGYNLDTAWSSFDTSVLKSVLRDQNTDSVVFLFGAFPRWDRSVPKDKKRHPFIILQGIPKQGFAQVGKGGLLQDYVPLSKPVYFRPKEICPPPNTGCTIPR